MMNPLDALIYVFIATSVASLLALCLMFLVRNELVKKISFYFLSAQGMLISWMNAKMTPVSYSGEIALGWIMGALCAAALLIEICGKGENKTKIARIMTAVALVAGTINAFVI